jgi:Cu-Zn family superoxide dismutase
MRVSLCGIVVSSVLAVGCTVLSGSAPQAIADVQPKSGSSVSGRVDFSEKHGVLLAHVMLTGLAPNSEHGFHVHDNGDCSAIDATSAGGHFNPTQSSHGQAGPGVHHAGDLPSLVADGTGSVNMEFELSQVTISAGPHSIAGRSLIVHRDRDDFVTQPTGNSGARIACGVIVKR